MILRPSKENLQLCSNLIENDELVAVPTETVYGLAGNALSEKAVGKIFKVKGRPLLDPLIIHCLSFEEATQYIESNASIEKLAEKFWPGPLTLIAKKKDCIPSLVTAGLPSVAIRVPAQREIRQLLKLCGVPLAAPSANPFGYVSPTEASHVERTLGMQLKGILDGGRCTHGLESTIIDVRNPEKPLLLRHGPIPKHEIEKHLQRSVETRLKGCDEQVAQTAPGMLSKHYSPHARVHLIKNGEVLNNPKVHGKRFAQIYLKQPERLPDNSDCFWLTEDGCMKTAAHHLFALMQKLDAQEYSDIAIEMAEDMGIGFAYNDRIKRAAAK